MPLPETGPQRESAPLSAETYTVIYPEISALPFVFINMGVGVNNLKRDISRNSVFRPQQLEIEPWRDSVIGRINWAEYETLSGGYSNLAIRSIKNPDEMMIVWRETDHWPLIMRSALLEDAVMRHFSHDTHGQTVKGRQLLDPNKPLEVTRSGLLVSKVKFLEGDPHRYPWNTLEIASVAKAKATTDRYLRHVSFDPHESLPANSASQLLHADFTRGNVLFKPGSPDVAAVIDYERVRRGSIEECISRTASYVLTDSKLRIPGMDPKDIFSQHGGVPEQHDYQAIAPVFQERFETLIGTYNVQVREMGGTEANWNTIITLTKNTLALGRFGSLDHIADMALRWLQDYLPPKNRSNTTTTG